MMRDLFLASVRQTGWFYWVFDASSLTKREWIESVNPTHAHINPDSLDTSQSSWDTVWVEGLEMCTFWKCPWCFRHFSGLVSSLSDDLWFQPWWNKKQYLPQSSGFCGIIGHALLLIIATIGFQLITSLLPNVTAYSLVESKLMITNHLPEEAAGPYSCILFLFCSWRRIIMKI